MEESCESSKDQYRKLKKKISAPALFELIQMSRELDDKQLDRLLSYAKKL